MRYAKQRTIDYPTKTRSPQIIRRLHTRSGFNGDGIVGAIGIIRNRPEDLGIQRRMLFWGYALIT